MNWRLMNNSIKMRIWLLTSFVCISLITLAAGMTFSAENIAPASQEPIEILADTLTVFETTKQAIFNGSVVATQGDMQVLSDTMKVYYASKGAQKNQSTNGMNIQKIEIDGNVSIKTKEETAYGKRGIYDANKSIFYLYDDVILHRGESTLTGDQFTYNRITNQGTLTRDKNKKNRVRATLITK